MIFSRELNRNFGKTIAWIIVISILTGLLIALYPMMLDVNMKSIFDDFLASFNPSLKNILGFGDNIDYTNLGQYLAFIFQYIAILVVIFAMQIANNSLSNEQGSGNIQYIYSNPISRSDIFFQKLFSNIVTYLLFLICIMAITFGLIYIMPLEVEINKTVVLMDLIKIFLGMFLGGLVYMSFGYLFSALSKSTFFSDGLSVLFVFLTVIMAMIGKVYKDSLSTITGLIPLEVFHPYKFVTMDFNLFGMGINLIVFVVLIAISYLIFNSKELDY